MAQYNWIDVQDENVPSLIEKINEQSTLKLFSEDRSHVEMAELPFYKNFKLVQATTFSSIPPRNDAIFGRRFRSELGCDQAERHA